MFLHKSIFLKIRIIVSTTSNKIHVTYPVPLQLVEVPLVPLSLELCLESADMPLYLVPGHLTRRHAIYDHRALT